MTFNEPPPSAITPATLLTPKTDLFGRRAARLRSLASNHPLANWLNWLADLAEAQQVALNTVPALGLHFDGVIDLEKPLLSLENPQLLHVWREVYRALSLARGIAPIENDSDLLLRKARECVERAGGLAVEASQDVSDIVVAAALQVVWSAGARQLALPEQTALANRDGCPCCGSAPAAGIVLAGEGKAGLRYLECSLCATRWNVVRARCTFCDDGSVVQYLGIDGGNEAVQAEACDHCHGYIKTFFQSKDILVEPLADDLASLSLDVLVGEQGFARGAPNLFLIEGESV